VRNTSLIAAAALLALASTAPRAGVPSAADGAFPSLLRTAPAPRPLHAAELAASGRALRWERETPPPQGEWGLEEKPREGRSLRNALLMSAALPGLGQRYLGAPRRGLIFMGAEAATWGTWGVFKFQEHLRRDNYIEMAGVFAGVRGDHDDDYWKVVGQFPSWLDYNEWLRFEARREFGFGTGEYYAYIAENEIATDDAWDWNSLERRRDYAAKRKASLNAERRATYTLYALLVNRVVALVDTWRLYKLRAEVRDRLQGQGALDLRAEPGERSLHWRLGYFRSF
jgi:hypothetical protein